MSKKVVRQSLSDQLYEGVKRDLMNGKYEPGSRITISGLAEEYGTSITPVREAVFRLVSEHALQARAATSFQVPQPNAEQLLEVQAIRCELEGRAAFEAAGLATPKDLEDLYRLQERFIAAAARDPAEASILNRDFHFAVLRLSGMPLLTGLCENMWVLIGPTLRLFHDRMPLRKSGGSDHRHHKLLAALEAKDKDLSRQAMQEDIIWAETLIREVGAEISGKASVE